jgi:alcohol dehydrogenase (NADP+)
VAVLGLGGIGHMAVKFAASFGADVTVLSGTAGKKESALALGATHFVLTSNKEELKAAASGFDFIIDTVSAKHDYNTYLGLLKKDGTMILLGVPPEAPQLAPYQLISKRRKIAGSLIGGIAETQAMLDYCAEKNIVAEVELINPDYINTAFERTLKGDVQYRFVIDMSRL